MARLTLNLQEAQRAIDNLFSYIDEGYELGKKVQKNGKVYSSGLENTFKQIVVDSIAQFGVLIVGNAVEEIMNTKDIDFRNPKLYAPYRHGQNSAAEQFSTLLKFESDLNQLANDLLDSLEEDSELEGDDLERYRRERKNLQSKIYRARKHGLDIPSLPRLGRAPTKEDFRNLEMIRESF